MTNIANWIERWAVATPEKIAIRFEEQEISYYEFDILIKNYSLALKSKLGVKPGDRVAYLGQNNPKMLVLLFACARLGLILVPLNWRLAPKEHLHMLKDSESGILFVDEPFLEQCDGIREELTDCRFVSVHDNSQSGWQLWSSLLQDTEGEYDSTDADLGSSLLLIYTSGTTGAPKGAVLSQEAIFYNALNSIIMHDMCSDDLILTILPLFHVGGLNIQTTTGFYVGATVLLHKVFNAEQVLNAIVHDRSSLTIILPAHMPVLRDLPAWDSADFSSLKSVTTGSSAIPDIMTAFWHERGVPLLQVYGSSETCPIAIHQKAANAFRTEGAIGFPAMHCDISIIDSNGNECDPSVPGEILVRGKNIMSQYWKNEEATTGALKDCWFHSNDIGYVDDAGCYYFVDRKNDVIISGGENIYPAEIENILTNHPGILEAAVVGREDPRWGEIAIAIIVNKKGYDLDRQLVLDWLEDKLGHYKHPREFLFVDALPRNEMRKVIKPALREMVKTQT